jgi:hypothetical protein
MRQTTGPGRKSSEKIVKDIKRATRKQYSEVVLHFQTGLRRS